MRNHRPGHCKKETCIGPLFEQLKFWEQNGNYSKDLPGPDYGQKIGRISEMSDAFNCIFLSDQLKKSARYHS